MGIDSRIEITVSVQTTTNEARSLPNTLLGLSGVPPMDGSAGWITITYIAHQWRRRDLHQTILGMSDVRGEDAQEPCGAATLYERFPESPKANRRLGDVLNLLAMEDVVNHLCPLASLEHGTKASIDKVEYIWT